MAARLSSALRTTALPRPTSTSSLLRQQTTRSFRTSPRMLQDVVATKKPVGAVRGTLFGFLLGSVLSGGALYYYVVDEYKISNAMLNEDLMALQSAVQRIETYVRTVEEEVKTKK